MVMVLSAASTFAAVSESLDIAVHVWARSCWDLHNDIGYVPAFSTSTPPPPMARKSSERGGTGLNEHEEAHLTKLSRYVAFATPRPSTRHMPGQLFLSVMGLFGLT
ncbi:hypothetical protein BXZ70DRAFT_354860 [Cristinia sonorae]|uniref:Uncharacterized protein n=1 Tax=Cristinia sonorae TaxID=1940300 RepID=A0A8K0UJM3_9AGAR|nr:hypothetical protein BXZ70DRAFT_354860 [Cristinia sonorae]